MVLYKDCNCNKRSHGSVLNFISTVVTIVGIIGVLLFIDIYVTLIGFLDLVIISFGHLLLDQSQENSQNIAEKSDLMVKSLPEGLEGIREVLISNNQDSTQGSIKILTFK